ncbi:hypothetical protein Cgig2_012729 [Carnegiea gigantea]|uniref:Sugar phosphate transporter domain-containing protein n=1 Tax=Carnegiea gigantea TaxID=171969 RepID=A0A9Q1QFC5_9CARY|nr:hypothetical protein Cgig2_012729 [Carnegiea gigantea]
MQSTAISISPSIPLLNPRKNPNRCFPSTKFDPFRLSAASSSRRLTVLCCSSDHSRFNLSHGSPSVFRESFPKSSLISGKKSGDDLVVQATSVPENADAGDAAGKSAFAQTLALGSLFGLWYLFNIYFNIYNKQVLKVFPYPMTVTVVQFAVGSVFVLLMWTLNIYRRPKISAAQLVAILPLAMVHTMGNLFTNMSLGRVAVSFTHTIKAMEPFFSVLLSVLFLGEESLDNITLFSIITIMSFILLAPVALFTEGVKFTPAYIEAAGLNLKQLYTRSLVAALCFHAYQQVSYMILQRVSPVTHSVGNCVKRVVVIVSSVLFFRTPVSPINALGTGIALAGVFFYSQVKRIKPKAKEA